MNATEVKTNQLTQEQIAIERLRRSRQELESKLHSTGLEAGRNFVLTYRDANAMCQRRLERAVQEDVQFDSFFNLAKVLAGGDGTEKDWKDLFRANFGDDIEEQECVEGFVEGALEKFQELKEKL